MPQHALLPALSPLPFSKSGLSCRGDGRYGALRRDVAAASAFLSLLASLPSSALGNDEEGGK